MKAITLFLLLFIQMLTYACTCGYVSLKNAYKGSDLIFIGKVLEGPVNVDIASYYQIGYKFSVSEIFKGQPNDTILIYTGMGGGDCGYPFEKDQTYLVYAYKNSEDENYSTIICTRTCHISKAVKDLEFLNRLPGSLNTTGITGQLFLFSDNTLNRYNLPVLKNHSVRFESQSYNFTVETDNNGIFYYDNIPPGTYTIIPDEDSPLDILQGHFTDRTYEITVIVKDNEIAERDIILSEPNIVSGILLDPAGRPIDGKADLIPEQWFRDKENQYLYKIYDIYTDTTGRFKFMNVPDGKYYLGVNLSFEPSNYSPYPVTFHNGAEDIASAELIELKQGSHISDVTIKVRKTYKFYKIRCRFETPDSTLLDLINMTFSPKEKFIESDYTSTRFNKNTWYLYLIENTEGWLVFSVSNTAKNEKQGLFPKKPEPIRIEPNKDYTDLVVKIELERKPIKTR